MDKPVISLVLQKFGLVPAVPDAAVVEVASGADAAGGEVVLWSENRRWLESTFSKRYLRDQRMVIAKARPAVSRPAYVGCPLVPGELGAVRARVQAALGGSLRFGGRRRCREL